MPLNYSKWDNLELSDDSDIEVHPNIDKKSFIRWKQRDIHEKRDARKSQKHAIRAEILTSNHLLPRLHDLVQRIKQRGWSVLQSEVERLTLLGKQKKSKAKTNQDGEDDDDDDDEVAYDDMVLSLLLQVRDVDELDAHLVKLRRRVEVLELELAQMDREDERKITSDGIRDGFDSGYVSKPDPPQPESKQKASPSTTNTKPIHKPESVVETLNSPTPTPTPTTSSPQSQQQQQQEEEEEEEEEEEITEASEIMRQFASLPPCLPPTLPLSLSTLPSNFNLKTNLDPSTFSTALEFLSRHKTLLSPSTNTTDSLLLEAFNSQLASNAVYARKCVEKALLIQYCNQLGPDGVNLFFHRILSPNSPHAISVYFNDILSTYTRIRERSKTLSEQTPASQAEEQIQLVPEDENTTIQFEIPDGPPPQTIELEGEAKHKLDVEHVKLWLQKRWQIWLQLEDELKTALKTNKLDEVNSVLAGMGVERAEVVVGLLDQAGILNFSSAEVRDETTMHV